MEIVMTDTIVIRYNLLGEKKAGLGAEVTHKEVEVEIDGVVQHRYMQDVMADTENSIMKAVEYVLYPKSRLQIAKKCCNRCSNSGDSFKRSSWGWLQIFNFGK